MRLAGTLWRGSGVGSQNGWVEKPVESKVKMIGGIHNSVKKSG